MHFFIDEAGSFAIPSSAVHEVGVAVGVGVADPGWPDLQDTFREFANELPSSARARGEPKGRLMAPEQLHRFTEILSEVDGLVVCPVTMDLGHLHAIDPTDLLAPFHDRLDEAAAQMMYPTAEAQVQLLARQARNLSPEQILRIQTWSRCLYETLHHAIIFLSYGPMAESWNSVRIEIDPVQRRPRNREQQFLSIMLFAWMMAWSVRNPFVTVEGLHTPTHPFVQNFVNDDGVVLSDLIRPNLYWPASDESIGLQIADVAATIVYQAATQLTDVDGAVSRFGQLMHSSPYGHARGPGLISPLPATDDIDADQYQPLFDVLRNRKRGA